MKHFFFLLLTIFICSICFKAYCQTNQDSAFKQSVIKLQKDLRLTDSVKNEIVVFRNQLIQQKYDLNKKTLSVDQRKNALTQIDVEYRKKIKQVLTAVQWQQYKQRELMQKNNLKQRMQNKKIKMVELDDNIDQM